MAGNKTEFAADPKQPTVVMTRAFDAPRRLVYEAMTNPELVKRWYGPRGFTVTLCEADQRVGGSYRIVHRGPDGIDYGFHGVYKELAPPSRRVYTWIFEMLPDKEAVITELLDEQGGKTVLTSTISFQSMADRDGYLASGAEKGAAESLQQLDEVIATLE